MKETTQVDRAAFEASVTETLDVISAFKRKRNKAEVKVDDEQLNALKKKAGGAAKIHLQPLKSQYEIQEKKGQGGMKDVYQAKDIQAMRNIAYAKIREDKETVINTRRFIREARITALLEHPNIIPVHDVGIDEGGKPYFTMKYLEGQELQDVLLKLQNKEESSLKTYSPQRLLEVFLDCCRAVAYAHSKGVLHLDLKPSNIHLSNFGEVLVLDWGIADFIGEKDLKQDLNNIPNLEDASTLAGTLKGTPGFMAPEQIDPDLGELSEGTDIYQLGCLLYAILTYVPPISGKSIQQMLNDAVKGNIKPPSTQSESKIPPALEAVVTKAMSLDPKHRYKSVLELIKDIQAYQDGYSTSAWNAGLWNLTLLAYRRHHVKVLTGLAFTFVVLLIIIVFLFQLIKSNRSLIRSKKQVEVYAEKVSDALDVAKEKEALALEKSKEARNSERQLNDFRLGVEGSFELARERLPVILGENMEKLKGYGRVNLLKFLMENDEVSFQTYPYDALWMIFESKDVSAKNYDYYVKAMRDNDKLNLDLYDQLTDILNRMRYDTQRVPVKDCHLALSILRDNVQMAPNAVAAFVMRRYHERHQADPTYPNYLEQLFELNSVLGSRHEADVNELNIQVSEAGWEVELNSTVEKLSLSTLAFLPIHSFKAVGCWADNYAALSTWKLKSLDLESSGFKFSDPWKFKRKELDYLRLIDCPFMNWPRLVDSLPAKELVVSKRASEYLNQKFMLSKGVNLKIDE